MKGYWVGRTEASGQWIQRPPPHAPRVFQKSEMARELALGPLSTSLRNKVLGSTSDLRVDTSFIGPGVQGRGPRADTPTPIYPQGHSLLSFLAVKDTLFYPRLEVGTGRILSC